MRSRRRTGCAIALFVGATLLIVGCRPARAPTSPQAETGPGPIPQAGPLAAPKSLAQVGVPLAATAAAVPADNRQTPDKIALGEKLFFDGRLSQDGTVACSTCHDPAKGFADGRPVSIGIKGRHGQRNAPTVLNALYNQFQFWDGRATTLEDQAVLPIQNPSEMGQPDLNAAVAAIGKIPEYQQAFQKVFGRPPNGADLGRALASYERTQVSFAAPFDSFMAGDKTAINDSAKRGWSLFNGKARCNLCHALTATKQDPTFFMDHQFHNIGVGIVRHNVVALACKAQASLNSGNTIAVDQAAISSDLSVLGRFLVSKQQADIAAFKTPGLRNVLVTAPYFHDGSMNTLWDVMDHYNKGAGLADPWLDQDIQPLGLSETEIDDVIAFMASLTSAPYRAAGEAALARQREIARTSRTQRNTARAFAPKVTQPNPTLVCVPAH
ncbi:MAG: cytochrome peroxidase [Phenylobacterium sp.]|nr:cytochrome peroxidase [Phenylobacterium sp.]